MWRRVAYETGPGQEFVIGTIGACQIICYDVVTAVFDIKFIILILHERSIVNLTWLQYCSKYSMNPLPLTNLESDHNDQAVITNKNMYVKRSNCTELLYTSCMYRFKEICTVHESWHAQTAAVQVRLRNENWGHK